MKKYQDCPQILREFLVYHETIKGQSQLTISEYYLDLRMFFRFMIFYRIWQMIVHQTPTPLPRITAFLQLQEQENYLQLSLFTSI